MKLFATVSFLLATIMLTQISLAQIQYYGIDTVLNDKGVSSVKLTITFSKPVDNFKFTVFGEIRNFKADSNAGPVNCKLELGQASIISCPLNLTPEKRTLDISFETSDFVKLLENKFYFNGDFSFNENINQVFASVKLPEGMGVVDENVFPEDPTMISDGRSIIAIWKLDNVSKDQKLNFQIMYERTFPLLPRLRYFAVFGVAAAVVLGLIILRYMRKPEEVVLSVLDEYERKIMNIIVESGGAVNQKKIVQETNLSKAKVSRVVRSLSERGLVEVERRGRTNIIKQVKKKFKYF